MYAARRSNLPPKWHFFHCSQHRTCRCSCTSAGMCLGPGLLACHGAYNNWQESQMMYAVHAAHGEPTAQARAAGHRQGAYQWEQPKVCHLLQRCKVCAFLDPFMQRCHGVAIRCNMRHACLRDDEVLFLDVRLGHSHKIICINRTRSTVLSASGLHVIFPPTP
jgi:hypothetical protein